jgi:hypothetical protein
MEHRPLIIAARTAMVMLAVAAVVILGLGIARTLPSRTLASPPSDPASAGDRPLRVRPPDRVTLAAQPRQAEPALGAPSEARSALGRASSNLVDVEHPFLLVAAAEPAA